MNDPTDNRSPELYGPPGPVHRPAAGWALSQSRFLRFLTFGALYFAQGVPWGFISVGYVVFLTDQGLSGEAIGKAIGMAYLPWAFKIVWAPLIDRFPSAKLGRRRPYIVAAELLMGITLLLLMLLDPKTQLSAIGVVLFLHNTCAALQDVAVDALAVDILPSDERGRANSIMWGAKSGGVAAGGGAGTILAKYLGWPALFLTMALLIWAIMLLPILLRERPKGHRETHPEKPQRINWPELRRSFTFAAPLVGLLIAFLTPAGYSLILTFTTRMFRADLKLTEEAIATLNGVVDPLSGVVGALIGGFIADRFGVRRSIGVFMAAIALTIGFFGAVPHLWPSFTFLVVWSIALNLAVYAYNAATLGFFMTLSNPAMGATHFAIYMATTNLCYSRTAPLGGWLADHLGYSTAYYIAAAVQLVTIPLLLLCDPRQAEARFRAKPEALAAAPGGALAAGS
jgi:MFS transporter, PAT family, beta-lactamase induction signal transducer AmpG